MKSHEDGNRVLISACLSIFSPSKLRLTLLVLLSVSGYAVTAVSSQDAQPVTASRESLSAVASQLKDAARTSFREGDSAKARESLADLLDLLRKTRPSDQAEWCQRLSQIALEYLRAGELDQALTVLGEAADLHLPFDENKDDGLASAAGGLYRRLAALDVETRFELLRDWSMPTDTQRTFRVLTSITPADAPPAVFARALDERPSNRSFAEADVGDVRGLFCSAWELVKAADDVGVLRRLTAELTRLADADVPNARFALMLAKIAAARRSDQQLVDELTAHAEALVDRPAGAGLLTLPLAQRVWRFGTGRLDDNAQRTIDFTPFPHWLEARSAWCGGSTFPKVHTTWCLVHKTGGIPGTDHPSIRRWIAPEDGTISVTGDLGRSRTSGNGIGALVVSDRSGFCGQWTIQTGAIATNVEAIPVRAGDTIDFLVDCIDRNANFDHFEWTVRIDLQTSDGQKQAFDSASGFYDSVDSHADLVIAAACLTKQWLQPISRRIVKMKLEQTYGRESLLLRPFLRHAFAAAIQKGEEDADRNLVANSDLTLWASASGQEARQGARGTVAPVWLGHDDHILHLTGPRNDFLFYKYPLTGDFQFTCETQNGGLDGTDGGIAYGGLGYEVSSAKQLFKVADANLNALVEKHCPFVSSNSLAAFNHYALTSTADGITFFVNRHPTWTDKSPSTTSPWIGLRSFGDRSPMFRNLSITGNPVIPREVKMSEGNSLRGWVASFYGERVPTETEETTNAAQQNGLATTFLNLLAPKRPAAAEAYDWSLKESVIHGARRPSDLAGVAQSRLHYFRPLQDGESISYEFEYEPGQLEVHPALGRLAFLIQPSGVRLHWMTSGDQEWTGLADDNAVVEPLNRRGPKPMPLKPGQWNRVTLALSGDTLDISLNGAPIYTRPMEPENARTFGFYHDKRRSVARVRDVVMRGDWPEQLTEQQRDNLAATSNPDRSNADRRVLGAVFDDHHVQGSVLAVLHAAAKLPADERYAFLSDWVLPSEDHASLRLALDFTPTNPPPPVSDADPDSTSEQTRVTTGGDLVSPALDLVEAAKELSKLDVLRRRVDAIAAADDRQHRSKLALLALIDIAAGDLEQATAALDQLAIMSAESRPYSFFDRWPETLVVWGAAAFPETREAVREIAFQLLTNQIQKNKLCGYEAWESHMRALATRIHYVDLLQRDVDLRDLSGNHFAGQSPLANWVPASRETTRTRGKGFPRSRWELVAPATVETIASHDDDYLFYRIPLRGNFEVECEVSGFNFRETNLLVAGKWVGPVYTLRNVDVGDFRSRHRFDLEQPFHRPEAWLRYRVVVRDGICTTYSNGRMIYERKLDSEQDPWLAIHSFDTTNGAVRNLRITGDPEIPSELRLTANPELAGWLPINEGHQVGPSKKWQHVGYGNYLDAEPQQSAAAIHHRGGGIHGIRWDDLPESHRESLIRYQRPMVEDGTIGYEFFYREGEMHVHPALDRLAFMLHPTGVRVHWVTDGKFDRTGLRPDNLFDELGNRRGPTALPLKPTDWNQLRLSLRGDTVDLELNGELVYQRKLEPTNQRTFGLFHYADRTEALVRNVVWRGDWPRELPPVAEQELAGKGTGFFEESDHDLPAVFHHEFTQEEFPSEHFSVAHGRQDDFDARADGLHVTRPGGDGYIESAIAPRVAIHGDFDITASFEKFDPSPTAGGSSGAYLRAFLDNTDANECVIFRRRLWHRLTTQPVVMASYVTKVADGARRDRSTAIMTETASGRMRLVRRGETVYYLFAEGDSPNYELLATRTTATDDVAALHLMTQTQGEGMTYVTWKELTVRADRITGLALTDDTKILAKLDEQRVALPEHFTHDFSKDPLTPDRFRPWGQTPQPELGGLHLLSAGTEAWTSSGITQLIGFEGDFDVAITFDEHQIGKPKEKMNSAFYLQIELPDQMQVNVILVRYPDGQLQAYHQISEVDAEGNKTYRASRKAGVDKLQTMRIARRGNRFSFIYRNRGSKHDQLLAETDLSDAPIPKGRLRLMLHTGGAGRQSQVLLKQLSIDAEKIDQPVPAPPESGGLLKSVLDLF